MVLLSITEFNSYSVILVFRQHSLWLPEYTMFLGPFSSRVEGGRGSHLCQVSVTHCGIFSPGKIGGNVDEAKLLLLVPEENCNNHFVCPKEHRDN